MYRFALKVYGCQMNVYDGDKMKTALVSRGWSEAPEEEADVVILNKIGPAHRLPTANCYVAGRSHARYSARHFDSRTLCSTSTSPTSRRGTTQKLSPSASSSGCRRRTLAPAFFDMTAPSG